MNKLNALVKGGIGIQGMAEGKDANGPALASSDQTNLCLPVCSLCCTRIPPSGGFKKCGACSLRRYCDKSCQVQDWKKVGHKKLCGQPLQTDAMHAQECPYSTRNPQIRQESQVDTGAVKVIIGENCQLITTGLNTCIFVVVKTSNMLIGWHASLSSPTDQVVRAFNMVDSSDFECGFIIPGVDRDTNLDLKRDCRTMRAQPWGDASESKRFILGTMDQFKWADQLVVLPILTDFKDFVVFDHAHARPYTFSDPSLFDEGCEVNAETASLKALMGGD